MLTSEEIKEMTKDIDYKKNFLKDYNGMLLTENQVEVLERYGIDIATCGGISELLFVIDEILDNEGEDLYDLEWVAETLQERNYYENTNK